MRAPKQLSVATMIISIVSFLGVLLLYNFQCMTLIYEILLALFGGASLGFMMSLIEYFAARRIFMEAFWKESLKTLSVINKAKYYKTDKPDELEECFDSYIEISNADFGALDNAIGNLDFLFRNKTLRKWTYKEIYTPIKKFRKSIVGYAYHFKLYKAGQGNIHICKKLLLELNEEYFFIKESEEWLSIYRKQYDIISNNIEKFRCEIYNQPFTEEKPFMVFASYRFPNNKK